MRYFLILSALALAACNPTDVWSLSGHLRCFDGSGAIVYQGDVTEYQCANGTCYWRGSDGERQQFNGGCLMGVTQ